MSKPAASLPKAAAEHSVAVRGGAIYYRTQGCGFGQ
jgi:hypothetical protein